MSEEIQILTLENPGDLGSLRLVTALRRRPSSGEVEVEVEAAALNFKDVLLALGLVPTADGKLARLGFECVGRVRTVGPGVKSFAVGDPVLVLGPGCLATAVCVPVETVRPRPPKLGPIDAVTIPVAFVTASYALEELARLRMSERILIHAATGGVGLAALQIAKRIGAEIFATAGSDEKRGYLHQLGVAHVMDSRTPAFAAEVLARTGGGGVDVVLNSLSGELLERSLAVLAPHGRFIELGARDAIEGRALALSLFARGASFCAVGYTAPVPRLGARFADIMSRAEVGEFRPLPHHVFPASEAAEAFAFLARARHIGKVVITFAGRQSSPLVEIDPMRDFLSPAEGVELFELVLQSGRAHVIVSKTELKARLARKESPTSSFAGEPAGALGLSERAKPRTSHAPRHPRPLLAVRFQAPRDDLEKRLAELWAQQLGLDRVGADDDFFALGGDSLVAVQLAHIIRRALSIELPAHLLLEHPTVTALAGRLRANHGSANNTVSRHLVRLAASERQGVPLFLIHPIGGHVYFYVPLVRRLAAQVPVYGIKAQGVDGESAPLTTIEEMARQYVRAIRAEQAAGPYRLGGSSFGGVVAFEIAQQLVRAGQRVELLALIDSPGPGRLPLGFHEDAEILAYLLTHGRAEPELLARLRALTEDERLRYFLRSGGAAEHMPPDVTVDGVRHFLRLFRANFDALIRYRPEPYSGPVLFFRAMDGDAFNPADLEKAWEPLVTALEVCPVSGNHTTMNLPPNVEVIARRLDAALDGTPKKP